MRTLFYVAIVSLGIAVTMWFAALHTAKAIARVQNQRIEQVQRDVAMEDGR